MLLANRSECSYHIGNMHLREYLARPGSLTVAQLRQRMQELGSDIKDDAQIRQWIAVDEEGKYKRFPSPGNARFIELATGEKVTRKDMRPHDYLQIWPELAEQRTAASHPGQRATDKPAAAARRRK
jgi:DNA-binding transcriptional regulator YdaS (Cro superfamily)